MEIGLATPAQLEELTTLFDAYRVFYGQPSDPQAARRFLAERLERGDSIIITAMEDGHVRGFAQLYPLHSSVAMAPAWVLNDTYVDEACRHRGVARALLETAGEHARAAGAVRVTLATHRSNIAAQRLYEDAGYRRDLDFYHYALRLDG